MRPISIPSYIQKSWSIDYSSDETFRQIREAYSTLLKGSDAPEVSVVIPAYNEEQNIVQTLHSLCNNVSAKSVEIIVVNNNSKDNTEVLVLATGVQCVRETKQGITAARNCGLANAKGKYILNADADSIYPKYWIEEMVKPLDKNENIVSVYGRFSFIPTGSTGRFIYFFYEYFADFMRKLNEYLKDEAVNVYGFNSGFRRSQGLQVDGFNHPPGTNEDGYLALKLRNTLKGKLFFVTDTKALVWTSDRRIQIDGGLIKAIITRFRKLLPKKNVEIRADL
ncbi:MAG TPA: glycosyltransferase family 2 protein [Chitinophagaceae bacterium]|nr:glycosyltransferase family 2 protein [Chitinophagaceae bacterium]